MSNQGISVQKAGLGVLLLAGLTGAHAFNATQWNNWVRDMGNTGVYYNYNGSTVNDFKDTFSYNLISNPRYDDFKCGGSPCVKWREFPNGKWGWSVPDQRSPVDGKSVRLFLANSSGYVNAGKKTVVPGSNTTISCQSAKASMAQSYAYTFTATTGSSSAQSNSKEWSFTATVGIEASFAFGGGMSASVASTTGTTETNTIENSVSDSKARSNTSTSTWALTPGMLGTPMVSETYMTAKGLWRLGETDWSSEYNGAFMAPSWETDRGGWVSGVFSMPANIAPVLSPGVRGMTIGEYRTYCPGDISRRQYAAVMKPALCKAGVDRSRTC